MAITFEQLLFFDDTSFTQRFRVFAGPSGSITTNGDGLYLANDSADPTSSVLNSSGSLITGLATEGAIYNGTTNWSIGIDQGHAYNVRMLSLIDTGSAGFGILTSGSGDSLEAYQSVDNSTWTLVDTYQPLSRVIASGSATTIDPITRGSISSSVMTINILGDFTQRYIKLYASNGPLKSAEGDTLWISGILTYQEAPLSWSSGSYSEGIRSTIQSGQVKATTDIITTYKQPVSDIGLKR